MSEDDRSCDSMELELIPPQGASSSELLDAIKCSILEGEAEITMRLVRRAIGEGVDTSELVDKSLVGSMSTVGRDFKNGEFYIPDVLMSSRALHAALFTLKSIDPESFSNEAFSEKKGTVVIGTVAGDLHDIGKNIAAFILQLNGFSVIDLGIDVVAEEFVRAVQEHRPDILGISALLTTTVGEMKRIIEALEQANVRDSVRVYVSGVPVTQELADMVGADHYSPDARDTIDYAKDVMGL